MPNESDNANHEHNIPIARKSRNYVKRGTITRVACEPCKRAKKRCDGARPSCSPCQDKGQHCVYNMTEKERSLTFVRKERRAKERENEILWLIIKRLKDADESAAADTFQLLRQRDDVLDLGDQLQAASTLANSSDEILRASSSESPLESSGARHAKTLELDAADLSIEGEYSQIKFGSTGRLAQDYTAVMSSETLEPGDNASRTDGEDDWAELWRDWPRVEVLSHLYFTWQHDLFRCFPEHTFREDLQGGHGDYYSPLLVHAICASGSLMSDEPSATDECMQHLQHALRLLQEGVANLATIAAASLLSHVEESRGRLSSMWLITGRMMRMAMDMQLHLGHNDRQISDKRQSQSLTCGFWGAFITDNVVSLTLSRLPSLPTEAITMGLPEVDVELDAVPWHSDDVARPKNPGMRSTSFRHLVMLSCLINSTLRLFFAPAERITAELVVREHNKYLEWFRRLPEEISSTRDAPPYVLFLHMQYHTAVLLLYRPFLSARLIAFPDKTPREICKSAAIAISEVYDEHIRQFDNSGICTFQVHCLLTACTIHLLDLKEQSTVDRLLSACDGLWKFAPRVLWAAAALHIIKALAQKWQLSMPDGLERALRGPSGNLPHFDFSVVDEANAYLLPQSMGETAGSGLHVPQDMQMEAHLFSPFPNQQIPLMTSAADDNGVPFAMMNGGAYSDGFGIAGMEFFHEDWFASMATAPWDNSNSR